MKFRRQYTVRANQHGRSSDWPEKWVKTNWRIRQVAAYMFRRFFGRAPDRELFGINGWFAIAEDRRGNHVHVNQINWESKALVLTRPCVCGHAPMVGLAVCEECHRKAA